MHPAPSIILFTTLFTLLAVGWVGACVMLRAAEVGELVMPLEDRLFKRKPKAAVSAPAKPAPAARQDEGRDYDPMLDQYSPEKS